MKTETHPTRSTTTQPALRGASTRPSCTRSPHLQSDMLGVALLATLVARAAAHGAVSWPRPRNAIDHEDAAAQANATYPYRGQACPSPDGPGRTTGVLGQACFWFSNGCAIGCASCDGKSRGPIPSSGDPRWRRKFDLCGAAARATVCDPRLRTVNTGAACGSEEDWYYYSPWRAPGAAPVFDACGMAGGTPVAGKFGGHYSATAHAKQGDLGSKTLRKAAPSVALEAESSTVFCGSPSLCGRCDRVPRCAVFLPSATSAFLTQVRDVDRRPDGGGRLDGAREPRRRVSVPAVQGVGASDRGVLPATSPPVCGAAEPALGPQAR